MTPTPQRAAVAAQTAWGDVFGYSRAVRVGPWIHVSGTTAVDAEGTPVSDDAGEQAAYAIEKIRAALEELGAGIADVVRTRVFITDISRWPEVADAHRAAFGSVLPASTLVEVKGLLDPRLRVEIEADALVDPPLETSTA